ncbi:MAG: H/ACA ribonucleoprotein complex subunit GAR1 [Thermoplasmatota archaeon]
MKPLGSVVNFSPKGSIVVKADITPRIGQIVCDSKGTPLGRIIRITGPVESPYVLVSPLAKDEMSLFRVGGKKVFLEDAPRQMERREHRVRKEERGPPVDRKRGGRPQYRPDKPKGGGGYKGRPGGQGKQGQRNRQYSKDRRRKDRK